MSKGRTVQWVSCPCGKRGFMNEHDADKALGRAQSNRARVRGARIESRYYWCERGDVYHLASMSKRTYQACAA